MPLCKRCWKRIPLGQPQEMYRECREQTTIGEFLSANTGAETQDPGKESR